LLGFVALVSLGMLGSSGLGVNTAQAQTKQALEIRRHKLIDHAVIGAGVRNERVIASMKETPRHEFVHASLWPQAYFDMALPIGEKQTISSPFIVAYMTESIDPQPEEKILEIGTGSGYQAAVLSPLAKEVYSIEIVPELGEKAARTLRRLGYENVFTKVGDGYKGWEEHAPFDKIIVTCSPEKVPTPLVEQLNEGGLMVIPVGERYRQTLYLLRKTDGKMVAEKLRPTLFVPMTGAAEDIRRVKPDPLNPKVVNSSFEETPGDNGFVPGWYYQRQLKWETDSSSPDGRHFVTFQNATPGRHAHLLQGFAIDGREVRDFNLSAQVKTKLARSGRKVDEAPMVVVTFFDKDRADLGSTVIGPFRGTTGWRNVRKKVRVPTEAREGILRVGLFGGVGEVSFDDVRIEVD